MQAVLVLPYNIGKKNPVHFTYLVMIYMYILQLLASQLE